MPTQEDASLPSEQLFEHIQRSYIMHYKDGGNVTVLM